MTITIIKTGIRFNQRMQYNNMSKTLIQRKVLTGAVLISATVTITNHKNPVTITDVSLRSSGFSKESTVC